MSNPYEKPLCMEIVLDGWAKPTALLYLSELAGFEYNPGDYEEGVIYIPPGATKDAPFGPAGKDCPYPILGKGTGLKPKYRFTPEMPIGLVVSIIGRAKD